MYRKRLLAARVAHSAVYNALWTLYERLAALEIAMGESGIFTNDYITDEDEKSMCNTPKKIRRGKKK